MFISDDLGMPEHVILVNDTSVSSVTPCIQEMTRGNSTASVDLVMLISSNYSFIITQAWNILHIVNAGIFELNKNTF